MSDRHITPETKQAFDTDGFVYLSAFLDKNETAELKSKLERYVREVVPGVPPADKFYEDKANNLTLKQLVRMNEHDDYFHRLCHGSRFEKLASLLMGGEVVSKGVEYFNKPPKIGRATPPHQDGYYFMINPCEAVTIWLALDDVDDENGCLRYVRGSHRQGMRAHRRTDTLGFSQGIGDYGDSDAANEVKFHAHPGDALVHHAVTIHRADGNVSENRTRQAIGLVYYSAAAKEDRIAQRAYQEKLERELAASGKI